MVSRAIMCIYFPGLGTVERRVQKRTQFWIFSVLEDGVWKQLGHKPFPECRIFPIKIYFCSTPWFLLRKEPKSVYVYCLHKQHSLFVQLPPWKGNPKALETGRPAGFIFSPSVLRFARFVSPRGFNWESHQAGKGNWYGIIESKVRFLPVVFSAGGR